MASLTIGIYQMLQKIFGYLDDLVSQIIERIVPLELSSFVSENFYTLFLAVTFAFFLAYIILLLNWFPYQ
jgi:hypothetical protein